MENVDANVPRRRGFMKNDIRIISEASYPNIKGISLKEIGDRQSYSCTISEWYIDT